MYISGIHLKRIRGFDKLDINLMGKASGDKASFPQPRMRTVVIGRNGTCKTTLLRCIAIGLASENEVGGFLTEDNGKYVAEDRSSAIIKIDLNGTKAANRPVAVTTKLGSLENMDFLEGKKKPRVYIPEKTLVCGYGVGRIQEGPEGGRDYRIIDSTYSLFNYETTLVSAELTIRRLKDYLKSNFYSRVMSRIKKALGLSPSDRIELGKGGGVFISGREIGKRIPLKGWADGHRVTLDWLLDVFAWALRANCISDSGEVMGILLVDELEQHIHPSLQLNILDGLSKLFPKMQMIVTTHSPLVALAALPSEVIALKRKGKKVVATDVPDFSGYSAEDMLVDSKLFDSDVYSPETNKKLTDYRRLISIPKKRRTEKQKKELELLSSCLISQQIPEDRESQTAKEFRRLVKKYNL